MVYMKDQVANSKCEKWNWCEMNVKVNWLFEKTLKDGQRSLRSRKAIFDQGGSNGAK